VAGVKYIHIEVMDLQIKSELNNYETSQNFGGISNIGVVNVAIKDAGGGGNCLYFSLYEALQSRGYLNMLSESLGMQFIDKHDFNIKIRQLIADHVDGVIRDMIQHFCNSVMQRNMPGVESLKISLLAQPLWLQNIIKKHAHIRFCGNVNQVYNLVLEEVKASIKTAGNWAGEIEVQVATNILDTAGIILSVHNTKLSKLIDFEILSRNLDQVQPHRIVLYNSGELHYQYYLFPRLPIKRNRQGGYRRTKKQKKSRKHRKSRRV